jgi:regulator of protease activity HflC (stomatin/prohibitin superfamily)
MDSKSFGAKVGALGKFLLVGIAVLLLLRFLPFTSVSAGHVGVVTTFGKVDPDVLSEGVHLINPISKVIELSTRVQKVVDDFSITNFNFSPSFNAAIEAKQEAEQLALKAKRDLERIRIEAEQKVTQANAEAEALRAQKQQVTPELIQLRQIEVQRQAVAKWDGHLPNVNSGVLPFLSLNKP